MQLYPYHESLQRKGNTAQLFKAEKEAGQQWVGLSLLTETSKEFTRRCVKWIKRDRFWVWLVCGHSYSEQRTAPIQFAARLKDKMSWHRKYREGPVTKLGR